MKGLTLDAGALIAFERNERTVTKLLAGATRNRLAIIVPSPVVAQVWRDGRTQVRLGILLASRAVQVEVFDDLRARAAGQLCGVTRTRDIVDASVVLTARRHEHAVVTSAPEDMERLDPMIELLVI